MANMTARIRLVVDVPFEFDVGEPDETGHAQGRIEAAKHAEEFLVEKLKASSEYEVVDVLIEQVSENE